MQPVKPLTRIVALALVPFLVIGSTLLYVWPGETERLFAWTIKPELTPLLMGAGYASGVVFFLFVARSKRWLEVSFGFVGVTVFATLMGIATILHWEKFNHDHITFFGWTALYAITPFLVPALWFSNGGWRPGPVEPPDVELPFPGRVALGVIGSAFFVVGLVIFVKPSLAVEHWPWDVTPLTARVVASFTALNVGWAAAALDKRWCALRIPCISQLTGVTLLLLGIVRAWDDVHTDRTSTWIYLGAQLALFTLLASLIVTMSRRRSV